MRGTALPTDGRFRFVASDRTGRPWITLIVLRGVHQTGTGSGCLQPISTGLPTWMIATKKSLVPRSLGAAHRRVGSAPVCP